MEDIKKSGIGEEESKLDSKIVIFHGLSDKEAALLMRLIKQNVERPEDFIFAVTTEHSLNWKVKDLIHELEEEHAYFRKNEREKQ